MEKNFCIWKKQKAECTIDEGYKSGCGTWINKEIINPYYCEYCPFCGREIDIYMSEKEIQERMKNEKGWLYLDERHLEQCYEKIDNKNFIQTDGDYIRLFIRFPATTDDFTVKKFLNYMKEKYNLEMQLLPQSGMHEFRTDSLFFKKGEDNENL